MNFDGLKDTIVLLLSGERKIVNISNFTNDMVTFASSDDVATLLIHLGYLGYDFKTKEVFIPNKEISDEFVTAIRAIGWSDIINAIDTSNKLLNATWNIDTKIVAQAVDKAHNEISIIEYNDENSLACVIQLAYYSARQYYIIRREMQAGKGFADLVFIPRKNYINTPAMVVELKWDKSAKGAIRQIEDKQYPEVVKDYLGTILLVGINYDKNSKRHDCEIKQLIIT